MRNGNVLKMRVSEIRVKQICVNQGLGVLLRVFFQCFDEQTKKKLIEYKSERKVNFGFKLFCVKMGVLNQNLLQKGP